MLIWRRLYALTNAMKFSILWQDVHTKPPKVSLEKWPAILLSRFRKELKPIKEIMP